MELSLANMTKFIRQQLKCTQRQLAARVGTNQTEILFIERGFIPDAETVQAIYQIYKAVKSEV